MVIFFGQSDDSGRVFVFLVIGKWVCNPFIGIEQNTCNHTLYMELLATVDIAISINYTPLGPKISPTKALLKMIFLLQRWDMLVPWFFSINYKPSVPLL